MNGMPACIYRDFSSKGMGCTKSIPVNPIPSVLHNQPVACKSQDILCILSLIPRSPVCLHGHLNWVIGTVVATHAFQTAHLPILAIHYNTLHAAKEQPDVTSNVSCVLSLAYCQHPIC